MHSQNISIMPQQQSPLDTLGVWCFDPSIEHAQNFLEFEGVRHEVILIGDLNIEVPVCYML
jgi:hypothetical protein